MRAFSLKDNTWDNWRDCGAKPNCPWTFLLREKYHSISHTHKASRVRIAMSELNANNWRWNKRRVSLLQGRILVKTLRMIPLRPQTTTEQSLIAKMALGKIVRARRLPNSKRLTGDFSCLSETRGPGIIYVRTAITLHERAESSHIVLIAPAIKQPAHSHSERSARTFLSAHIVIESIFGEKRGENKRRPSERENERFPNSNFALNGDHWL